MAADLSRAEKEVWQTLKPVTLCMKFIGISLNDDYDSLLCRFLRLVSFLSITYMVACFIVILVLLVLDSSKASVDGFTACVPCVGFGIISYSKYLQLCLKQPIFKKMVKELMELWPVATDNEEAEEIKRKSLSGLRLNNYSYLGADIVGMIIYNIMPAASTLPYFGSPHVLMLSAVAATAATLASDMLFVSMSSHITLLLRFLQLKIRNIGMSSNNIIGTVDCYEEIILAIQTHQRLIRFTNDIEDLFCTVNSVIIVLSSINICCIVFNIALLEPLNVLNNKLDLVVMLTQIGIICWYADEIFRTSMVVEDSVFESGWYRCNPRCRRAMLMIMLRAQKPICFTTMKFRKITLETFSSMLTSAYSYFALLHTMYRD